MNEEQPIRKIAGIVTVSNDLLRDILPPLDLRRIMFPTEAERAEDAAYRKQRQADHAAACEEARAEHAALLATVSDPFRRMILEMHGPLFPNVPDDLTPPHCGECQGYDDEGEVCAEHPCDTYVRSALWDRTR